MKLGRVRSKPDSRDRLMANYLTGPATMPPPKRDWSRLPNGAQIAIDVFGNFDHGCCTCASIGHGDQIVAAQLGEQSEVTPDLVLEGYDAISEWDRDRPEINDNGASNRDALNWFKKRGIVDSYVSIDELNKTHWQIAINESHGVLQVGADLPIAAQKQEVWDVAPANKWTDDYRRRSWGGHAMVAVHYDYRYVWFATWGRFQRATWAWCFSYVDEARLVFLSRLIRRASSGLTPSGLDLARLRADVARIAA